MAPRRRKASAHTRAAASGYEQGGYISLPSREVRGRSAGSCLLMHWERERERAKIHVTILVAHFWREGEKRQEPSGINFCLMCFGVEYANVVYICAPPHALSPQPRTRLPDRQHYGLQIAERATKDALLVEEQEVKGILSEHAAIKVRTHSSTHTLAPTLPCAHMARGNGGLSTSSCSNDVHVRRIRCIMPVYRKQANAEAQSRTHIYIHILRLFSIFS